jgi:hypothetical protein
MKKLTPNTFRFIPAALGLVFCLLANHAGAQTEYFWDNNGLSTPTGGVWDTTTANWATSSTLTTSTTTYASSGGGAVFCAGGTSAGTITVTVNTADIPVGFLDNNGVAGTACTLYISGTGSLSLGMSPYTTFYISTGYGTTVNIPIDGTYGIAQHGGGYLSLYGNNTYSGGTSATGGQIIYYNNGNSFGTGPISTSGGATSFLLPSGTGVITIPNAFNINSGTTTVNFGSGNTICSGPWSLGVTPQLKDNHATQPLTISGPISGAFGVQLQNNNATAVGNGLITFSGPNTYTGQTSIGALAAR